jgi:hypothetical protein
MQPIRLIRALCNFVASRVRRRPALDITLLQDAEFQILLHELHYPRIPVLAPLRGGVRRDDGCRDV